MKIRRELFTYTVIFTAGVTAGFFIFERTRLAGGVLIMAAIGIIVTAGGEYEKNQAYRIIAVMMAGFLIFTCSYIHYGISERELLQEDDSFTGMEGRILDAVKTDKGIRLVAEHGEAGGRRHKVLVNLYSEYAPEPADVIGMRVNVYGTFRQAPSAENPGCFDYRLYLRSRGISCMFTARSIEVSEEPAGVSGRYRRHLFLLRENFLNEIGDEEIRAFIRGVVFGDKTQLGEDVRNDFNYNGTGHILAVSGLHTGFLYALLRLLAGRKKMLPVTLLTIAVLFMYGEMTMWSPSTVRSVTVLSISMLSVYARRPFDLLSAASAAALMILIIEPYQLFNSGFQMSFAAIMGIAFLTGPLSIFIGESAAVMTAVQLSVAPLTAFVFHRLNVLSVFINIPVILIAGILVPVCMAALMLTLVFGGMLTAGPAGDILFKLIEGLSELILRINSIASADGFFSNQVTAVSAGILILLYLALFLVSSEWFRVRIIRKEYRIACRALICAVAVSLCFGLASYNQFADDEIVFVSVGQGDCTHIRAGGRDVLIDGGGDTDRNIGEDTLMPYLLSNGAGRLEMALVTHLHTDHCLGILQLASVYPIGKLGIPEDYRKAIEQNRKSDANQWKISGNEASFTDDPAETGIESLIAGCGNIQYLSEGTRIYLTDDVFIDPVWPLKGSKGDVELDDANENNMVFIVNYRGYKAMVTGDLLEEDELEMVRHYRGTDTLDCDILKVAHHGSKSSSSEEFLDAVSPDTAVIQVGKNNFYGHPHDQTLDRLAERGIKVYRTDINGAVGIDIRHKGLKVDVIREETKHTKRD